VTASWRKPHNEELRNLYFSPSTIQIIKRRTWAGQAARLETGGEERNDTVYWWENHKERDHLERRRWVDNIEIKLGVGCIDLTEDRRYLVYMVNFRRFLGSWSTGAFS
jgi:hypothetical protein